jgi:hypothetical protein
LEAKDNEYENDLFYTPPNSPFKPISIELEEHLVVDHGKRHLCILLENHLKICDKILYPQPNWPHRPPQVKLKFVEEDQVRLSRKHISSIAGPLKIAM